MSEIPYDVPTKAESEKYKTSLGKVEIPKGKESWMRWVEKDGTVMTMPRVIPRISEVERKRREEEKAKAKVKREAEKKKNADAREKAKKEKSIAREKLAKERLAKAEKIVDERRKRLEEQLAKLKK